MGQSIDIYPAFLSFWGQIAGDTSKITEVNYSVKLVKRNKLLPFLYSYVYYCLNFAAQDGFEMVKKERLICFLLDLGQETAISNKKDLKITEKTFSIDDLEI